ncbi:MAG: hypothetical protein RLZ62_2190 [Bacteroidota bacterium]|jgi:hypothetical protein
MNNRHKQSTLLWIFLLHCFFAVPISAQNTNQTINIQGTLRDASGKSVENGVYPVTFRLYSAMTDGSLLWQETGNVEVRGGIYSYNLGSVQPLVSGLFGSIVYMGLTFNGFEMSPRTELTYAPYALACNTAQTVACSGALGDIKYSILAPAQFALVNGDCWVPMNGSALPASSALRMLTGRTVLPDGGGVFIHGQEYAGGQNNDTGRTPASPIATLQADELKSHNHTAYDAGSHTHGFVDYVACCGSVSDATAKLDLGTALGNDELAVYMGNRIVGAGEHSHSITNTGGVETRSKNLNLWIYIRIN